MSLSTLQATGQATSDNKLESQSIHVIGCNTQMQGKYTSGEKYIAEQHDEK